MARVIGYARETSPEINYSRRSRAGKTIGSGREYGVDLTVGSRQLNSE